MASPVPPRAANGLKRTFHGCSGIREYEVQQKLGEGTFGEVHKARCRRTGAVVALKKILMHNEKDGFPITALREIKLLKMLSHVNVLKLEEMAVERNKTDTRKKAILYMVTPYMDHDLSGLLDNPDVNFTEPQIKCYMLQLLEGLRYLHDSRILHRDMKAANLLINNKGLLQIADFGLARHYEGEVPRPGKGGGEATRDYTALVVTRWYRPPELLLGLRQYTTAIDMWGAGCVFGEMFKRKPILAGSSDVAQVQMIFDLVGAPAEENMPGWSSLPGCEGVRTFAPRTGNLSVAFSELSKSAINLLSSLLKLDWRRRLTAVDALQHPYFTELPLPARPEDLPRFADSHELDRRNARGNKAALPPAPAGGTVGMGPNGEWAGGSGPPPTWQPTGGALDRGRYGQDRRPPAPPGSRVPHGFQDHNRNGPPPRRDPYGRAPPQAPDPPGYGSHGHVHGSLPPRPPPPSDMKHPLPNPPRGGYRDRDGPPPGASRGAKDTFIPDYSNGGGGRPPRDDRDRRDDRRSWERDDRRSADRDERGYVQNGRRRSRDDGYGGGHRDRDAGRDRDRDRDRRMDYRPRGRSRSPERERQREERQRDSVNVYRR